MRLASGTTGIGGTTAPGYGPLVGTTSCARPRRATSPSRTAVSTCVAGVLVVFVLLSVVAGVTTALSGGCTMNATELTSCAGFTGTTLNLQSKGIASVAAGAFAGLTLTSLYVQQPEQPPPPSLFVPGCGSP